MASPSRPLPRVQVEYPSADRGADDVREHLDAPECALCGCPDAPGVLVELPWTGKRALRRVCRGHSEHPEHPGHAEPKNPTDMRYCPRCGHVDSWFRGDVCHACSYYKETGDVPFYCKADHYEKVVAADERSGSE